MLDFKKIKRVTDKLGRETGELGVKIFHKSITKSEAKEIQIKHCRKILRHYGKPFCNEVYKLIYILMTNINYNRQIEGNPPVLFYTDGMDEYFHGLGIKSYDCD